MAGINFNSTDNKVSTGGGSSNVTQSEFTAGEALTAGDALRMGVFPDVSEASSLSGTSFANAGAIGYNTTYQKQGQSFTCAANRLLKSIVANLRDAGAGGSGNLTCKVYSDTSGTLVATSSNTVAEGGFGSGTDETFTFTNETLGSGTYYILIETDRANDGTNFSYWNYNGSDVYAGGQFYSINSSNVWDGTLSGRDKNFAVTTVDTTETLTEVYKTDATSADEVKFVGFANETVSASAAVNVNTAGVDNNQSGLTTNSTYYLSDTAGAISTTPGTNEKAVGVADSATELAINLFSGGGGSTSYAFANMTGRTAGGDHTLTNGYKTVDADYTINATNITVNFDGYVNVRTLISMGTIDNDTNFGLALHKNGTDQGTSTLATYNNDESDTFDRFPMYGEWTLSVADGDTLSIRGEVVSSLDTGKFTVKRVA